MAIDQGTTSTRAIIFDAQGAVVATAQREHRQSCPRPGWVEHDAAELWRNTCTVVTEARAQAGDVTVDAVGVTNQRETTVAWDRRTGRPLAPAIVWQDTRTQELADDLHARGLGDRVRELTGLPLAAYFSATKIAWMLAHVPEVGAGVDSGDVLFGTVDSWLVWNLTGGPRGGVHVTDVTNASRTLLMDLRTLTWSDELLGLFGIPRASLPGIRSSGGIVGEVSAVPALDGVPIAAILGDQQAAAFGQKAFEPGESKTTYGTGSFMLVNTGAHICPSGHGLIATAAYQCEGRPATYALEGAIAVAGSLVQWLRDEIGLIEHAEEIEHLATQVPDAGGVVLVPAFSGLFAPYWRSDARGAILGLTRFTTRHQLARAALDAVAFQVDAVLAAMREDTGLPVPELRVDGGMVANGTLMQLQADVSGVPVVRSAVTETTALGAAFMAGLTVGVWRSLDELRAVSAGEHRWLPAIGHEERMRRTALWRDAVPRTFNWPTTVV